MKTSALVGLAATFSLSSAAIAGPAHVLRSQVIHLDPGASYAIAPQLDAGATKALAEGLQKAGLRVVSPSAPHTHLVTATAQAGRLCTASCSSLTQHNDAALDDYFRHEAIVVAQPNRGDRFYDDRPLSWYTLLQSDGLSERRSDYLSSLLKYGARAYGRTTLPQALPRLTIYPNVVPPGVTVF